MRSKRFEMSLQTSSIIIINGIFTQDNPSVLSTAINGVLLTNKSEIIKIYKLKTIKNYNRSSKAFLNKTLELMFLKLNGNELKFEAPKK